MVITQQQTVSQIPKKKELATNEVSATMCSNCGTTTTPLWRRAPNGDTICNACGLYLKARNTLRPPSMKRNLKKQQQKQEHQRLQQQQQINSYSATNAPAGTCPGGGQCNGTGGSPSCEGCPAFNQHQVNRHALICANCRTTTTPLWRRDEAGNTICNACGLYYKLHAVHRPVSMKRSVIKRRKRIMVSENEEMDQDDLDELDSSNDEDDEEKVKEAEKKRKRIYNKKTTCIQSSQSSVPAIEDYIIPKRTPFALPVLMASQSQTQVSTPKRFDPLFDYRSNVQLPPIVNNTNPYQDLAEFDNAMTRLERLRRRVPQEQNKVLSRLTNSLQEIVSQAENILSNS
jgi:ribosomal protein L37AE/L43A